MESEDETRRHGDEVSPSEISEVSSFMSNDESMDDTDSEENQTSKEQADEKETIEDTECREDRTKEGLEDEDCGQYMNENISDEKCYTSDDTDEDDENLEESGKSSNPGGDEH